MVARDHGLPVVVLRTSRFFPETDDDSDTTSIFVDGNIKANEFLYRRVDIEDVVSALCSLKTAPPHSALPSTSSAQLPPFTREDADELARDAPAVVRRTLSRPAC